MPLLSRTIFFLVPASILYGPIAALAQGYGDRGHMGGWGGGWGWTGMIIGPIMMLLFIAAIVAVIVLVVRWLGGGQAGATPGGPAKTALDILGERFARGEIDQAEFEERKRVLTE